MFGNLASKLFKDRSLQFKILSAITAVTIVSVIVANSASSYFYNILIDNIVGRNFYEKITQANMNFDNTLKDIDNISAIVAINKNFVINVLQGYYSGDNELLMQENKKLIDYLGSIYTYKPYISGITIFGTGDRQFSVGESYERNNFEDQNFIDKMTESKGSIFFFKKRIHTYSAKENTVYREILVACRGIVYNGKTIGYIVIYLNDELLKNLMSNGEFKDANIFIYDSSTNIIYKSDSESNDTELRKYIRLTKQNTSSKFTSINVNKKRYILTSYTSDYTGWTTLIAVPEKYFQPDEGLYNRLKYLVVLFIIMLVLIGSRIISMRITSNLEKLSVAVTEIGQGNLDYPVSIADKDEIGELSRLIAKMSLDIKTMMKDLKVGEEKRRELEINALQSQINPHFLYNTLNTIKYMAVLHRAYNISDLTTSLVELLRTTVGTKGQLITLDMEIQHVRNYINIQKYKYIDKFDVIFQVEEGLEEYKTLKLMLQPVVENAIFHGIERSGKKGIIVIKVFKENDKIILSVKDNGAGMDKSSIDEILSNSDGNNKNQFIKIGINNVNERIKLFFGSEYGINIESELGFYTRVDLIIPAVKGDEEFEAKGINS